MRASRCLLARLASIAVLLGPLDAGAELLAGFGVAPLPTPENRAMAGYGGLRARRARGVLDPPEARAVVVDDRRTRIAIVSVDLVIARGELRSPLLEDPELDLDVLMLGATHTHSGPGGYLEGWLAEKLTSGPYEPSMPSALVAAARAAIAEAIRDLAPARAGSGVADLRLARNRRGTEGPAETALPVLLLELDAGRPPIVVFSYGAHPTVLSRRSRRYSADYVGEARRLLDERGWRSLYLAGALGDQEPAADTGEPARGAGGAAGVEAEVRLLVSAGARLGQRVIEEVEGMATRAGASLEVGETVFERPPLRLRRFCAMWWAAPLLRGPARRFLAEQAPVQAIRIGEALLLGLPAEPTSAVGNAIRSQVPAGLHAFVIGHANDWLGYAVTPEAHARGGYEACMSFFGPTFATLLIDAARHTIARLEDRVPIRVLPAD